MRTTWLLPAAAILVFPAAVLAQPERPLSPGERVLLESPMTPMTAGEEESDGPPEEITEYYDPTPYRNLLRQRRARPDDFYWQTTVPRDDIFRRGQWSMSYLSGYTVANLGPRTDVPFDMLMNLVRINCMWNPPRPNRRFKGSHEGILELDVLPVVNGPASIVIGGSLMWRYNFRTHKEKNWNVYFQYGGGGMYTDAYLHGSPVLSSGFEFIIQMGLGLRVMLNPRWSLNAEYQYYHFSNGGIVLPNIGTNMQSINAGLTYYFKRRHR